MVSPIFNIIGAGRLGTTLGFLLTHQAQWSLQSVCNKQHRSAIQATHFIGHGKAVTTINQLPKANVWIIATPDDDIAHISQQLAQQHVIEPGNWVIHLSGALDSNILKPLQKQGAAVASIHLMHSFEHPKTTLSNVLCALEGDNDICQNIMPTLTSIGCVGVLIPASLKPIYHAMGVFASNYLFALLHMAQYCGNKSGLDPDIILATITTLAQRSLDNFEQNGLDDLTGPVARGDDGTVTKQYQTLQQHNPTIANAYLALADVLKNAIASSPDDLGNKPVPTQKQALNLMSQIT